MKCSIDLFERLKKDAEFSAARDLGELRDTTSHLNERKRLAWSGILSSIATAEAMEEELMRPMVVAFSFAPHLAEYLQLHADDESRHSQILKTYIKKTFHFEKKRKTLTDKIIFDGIFRRVGSLVQRRPLAFLAALYFYEEFSAGILGQLKNAARRDNLAKLNKIIENVEHDELRHRTAVKYLFSQWKVAKKPIDRIDLMITKSFVSLVRADVNLSPWAIYNYRARKNLRDLGLQPRLLLERSRVSSQKSYEAVAKLLS